MPMDRMVGEAYILMRGDGTLLERDMRSLGKKAGKGYGKQFDKELKAAEKGTVTRFRRTLASATADVDFSRFRKEFGTVDETIAGVNSRLEQMSRNSLISAKSAKKVKAALDEWGAAQRDLARDSQRLSDSQKSLSQFFKDQQAGLVRLGKAERERAAIIARSAKAYQSYAKNIEFSATREERALADQNKAWLTYGRNVQYTLASSERALDAQNKAWLTYSRNIDTNFTGVRRRSHLLGQALDRAGDKTNRFNFIIGKTFGKGSRNNFLNWMGSMIQGLTTLGTTVPVKILQGITSVGNTFSDAFSASRALGVSRLASAGKGLMSVFGGKGGIVGAVVGTVIGLIAFAKVLPSVISLMTMLGGVVSAVAGSISIGLAGALLAIVPLAAGAVAGLGALAGVFTSFFRNEKNAKFIEKLFKPFRDLNESYYPEVRSFLTNISRGFDDLIKDIRPSLDAFFSSFQKKMNDPTTQSALAKWSDSIGRIATSLSLAGTSFLSGLVGFFVPVLPYAERLATAIKNIAADFDRWANSKGGQDSITGFMSRAFVAAEKVWKILGNIGGIIGDVFMGGEKTGTTLLDRVLQKLQEINTYLDTPKGKASMDKWFGNVEDIGRDLGELATNVGTIIKNFNSPEGQANAKAIMDSIVSIGNAGVKISAVADDISRIMDALTKPIPTAIGALASFFGGKIYESNKGNPKKPQSVPSIPDIKDRPSLKSDLTKYLVQVDVDDKLWMQKKAAIEAYQMVGKTISIKGNEALWEATRGTIAAQIFTPKQITVEGNEKLWNQTKGTIASYVFKSKIVKIEVAAQSVMNWVAQWNRTNLNKTATIRYAISGNLPNGGRSLLGGNLTASGGLFNGAQLRTIGEAGPEAVVPLKRNLSQVDPSVRALSAIAQGMKVPAMAAGGVAGGGRQIDVTVEQGAVQVVTKTTSPNVVGSIVLDGIADAIYTAVNG